MPSTPDFASLFPQAQQQLACPACHGALQLQPGQLTCTACGRRYPIVDGIPVLIPAAAES